MIDQERMKQDLARLRDTVAKAADALKLPHLREELAELKEEMNAPEFWNNLERSTAVNRKVSHIESKLDHVKRLETRADDVEAMLELLSEDEDEGIAAECEQELESLSKDADALELETLMRGDYDSCNAVLSLHAGAGGTEAQDWTQMLYRMYTRYCERHGFKVTVNDLLDGDEAGIKSVTFQVDGENAYGFLRSEKGVHRLVREYSETGGTVIIAGQREHPEVVATAGWCRRRAIVVGSAEEARQIEKIPAALVVAQTTLTQGNWEQIIEALRAEIHNAIHADLRAQGLVK